MRCFKKIFLTTIALLAMMPFIVNAEVKEIDDVVYTFEEMEINDLVCDDIKNDELWLAGEKDNKYSLYSVTKDKYYLVDLEKNDNCTELTLEEAKEFNDDNIRDNYKDNYTWEKDNTIRKNTMRRSTYGDGYVLADKIEEGKTYYQKVPIEGWVEAKSDVDEPYYEKYSFDSVRGEYIEGKEYYQRYDPIEGAFEKVENPTEEEFKKARYFLKSTQEPEGEIVYTLTNTKFYLPKETTGLEEDITLSKDNFVYFQTINGEHYLSLYHEKLKGLAIFKVDGTYVDGDLINILYNSKNNAIITLDINNKIYIRDSKYNLIYQTEAEKEEGIGFDPYSTSAENTDYFFILNKDTKEAIIKLSHYYVEEGKNQKYNNTDLTFKFSGSLKKLKTIKINDQELNKEYYTVASGSTILTLKNDYLKTLEKGTYKVTAEYTDGGYVNTTFEIGVKQEEVPKTFDRIGTSVIICTISVLGLSVALIYLKKQTS